MGIEDHTKENAPYWKPAGNKSQVSTVFIGHIDSGKSTLVGRILVGQGAIDPHKLEEIKAEIREKYPTKDTFEYAFIMDDLIEERKRGITIRSQIAEFETKHHYFTIKDAPGHPDFINNMIRGSSQAEAAVLLIDVNNGIEHETKEHAVLARTFGIEQIVVALNKMDKEEAGFSAFSEQRYKMRAEEVTNMLMAMGYAKERIALIPISAYKGDNVSEPSPNMKWYSGSTLISALDNLEPRKNYDNHPLRFGLTELQIVKGAGYVLIGDVYSGTLSIGDEVIIMPGSYRAVVRRIEKHHKEINIARTGDPIGINLRVVGGWPKNRDTLHSGYVLSPASDPATVAKSFSALMTVLNRSSIFIPTDSDKVKYSPTLYTHKAITQCILKSLDAKLDPTTMQVIEEHPQYLRKGDIIKATFEPVEPLVVERYREIPPLGRFAIREQNETIAAGIITDIEKKE